MPTTLIWWTSLCVAAIANAALWICSARRLRGRQGELAADIYRTRRTVLWLSALYVAGCGFRSFLPMVDVPRICLHDTPLSRIFVGRMVATVAELAFSMQWVLLLREAGAHFAARAIVPLLVGAELFSWFAVLSRNNLFHAVENSLWTLSAALAALCLLFLWNEYGERGRRVLLAVAACAAGYVAFMLSYDVPMYLGRWQAGIPVGTDYPSFEVGLRQLLAKCTVTWEWSSWWQDAVWLSAYFTLAVWISIALPQMPELGGAARSAARASRAGSSA
jgi:hypothetical protein